MLKAIPAHLYTVRDEPFVIETTTQSVCDNVDKPHCELCARRMPPTADYTRSYLSSHSDHRSPAFLGGRAWDQMSRRRRPASFKFKLRSMNKSRFF